MADIFTPLTPAERADDATPPKPKPVPIVPVPEEAPACAWRHPQHGAPIAKWPYHDAGGRLVAYAARVEYRGADGRLDKDVLPLTYCLVGHANGLERCAWRACGVPAPRPLYRLPELLADCQAPVIVTEGEKTADAVRRLFPGFLGTTSMGGAKAAKLSDLTPLASRSIAVWPDHDETGRRYAEDVARLAIAAGVASVAIVAVPADWPEGWDLADTLPNGVAPETLGQLLAEAALWTPPAQPQPSDAVDDEAEIARLAVLPPLTYERERGAAAKRLRCRRVSTLDELVDAKRREGRAADAANTKGQGRRIEIADIVPWPEPVDGAALIDEVAGAIRRYVVLDLASADATALWTVHTHALDAAYVSPRLEITSPEKRCGKSTLLTVLGALVARPQPAANITTATLFRAIEAAQPTLLVDEADTFLGGIEEMRGLINAGHCRANATVLRSVETRDGYEVRTFDVWGAMALAAIGRLPATIEDRSVRIALRRRRPDEPVERLRLDRLDELTPIARRAARWAADHLDALSAADPDVPAELNDRAADNWRPLLAVADLASGGWSERARHAALALAREGAEDGETARTLLLGDLRELFAAEPSGVLLTAEILRELHARDDRRWPEYRGGRPITARQMAALLRPVGISAGTVRRGDQTAKGYRAEDMADAWSRYLPGHTSVTLSHPAEPQVIPEIVSVTSSPGVTDAESPRAAESATCDGVTNRDPLWWRKDDGAGYERDPEEAVWTG
jgi:putative DNA primase/helicase